MSVQRNSRLAAARRNLPRGENTQAAVAEAVARLVESTE